MSTYDAENRLISVSRTSPSFSATFIYDGDGNRIKATVSGTTTTYIGNWFEWDGTAGAKYYYAAGQRVAMRNAGGSLRWMVSDHLGSTSQVADINGNLLSTTLYKPWGEVRYQSGTLPTDYTYTGQYSESYINLLFYGSRRYDPALGRFIQPDTIIPGTGNPMAYDRFAYTLNNPLRYVDPTGHRTCTADQAATGDETCQQNYNIDDMIQYLQDTYNWTIRGEDGDWTVDQILLITETARDISNYVAEVTGGDGVEWIRNNLETVFHNITGPGNFSYTLGNHVFLNYDAFFANKKQTIAHELAHVYDNNSGPSYCLATFCGKGYGSEFLQVHGGTPGYLNHLTSSRFLAFDDGPDTLAVSYLFREDVNGGYGNGTTADYFAEAFSWSIYDRGNLPYAQMHLLINLYIRSGGR